MLAKNIVRYLYWGLWFPLLPALGAVLLVGWLSGLSPPHEPSLFRTQQVPLAILLFTLSEMALYYFRHHLPFADRFGGALPRELPRHQRQEVLGAVHLLDEVQRLLSRRRKAIQSALATEDRAQIDQAVNQLRDAVQARPLDTQRVSAAKTDVATLVDRHLSPWRKSELRENVESVGTALIVALLLRALVFEAFQIPSGSMLPTLQIGDHIFVNKFTYGPTLPLVGVRVAEQMPPERGDVIVFQYPDPDPAHGGQDYIKRVIALPGDVLEVHDGHPVINGWRVPSCHAGVYRYSERDGQLSEHADLYVEFLGDMAYLTLFEQGFESGVEGPFRVREGEVYVMGDNRDNSHDSRRWNQGQGGGVPFDNIRGRAMRVWWPLGRFMVPVMGKPTLPSWMPSELTDGVQRCLAQRPNQTRPPPRL